MMNSWNLKTLWDFFQLRSSKLELELEIDEKFEILKNLFKRKIDKSEIVDESLFR